MGTTAGPVAGGLPGGAEFVEAAVPVDGRNHSFSIDVPPGDVRVVKIVE